MSLISEQVKKLRDVSDELLKDYPYKYMSEYYGLPQPQKEKLSRLMLDAAETISDLSAKLHAANMERSSMHYHGGWVPVSEKPPEEHGRYLTYHADGSMFVGAYSEDYEWGYGHYVAKVIAWMPLPTPYTESSNRI